MADVAQLKKLNREQLDEFAKQNGIENPSDTSKYPDKQALAEAVSPKVTPEQLAEYRVNAGIDSAPDNGQKSEESENSTDSEPAQGDETPQVDGSTPVVTSNSAPPAPGEAQIVDHSAPADDNIEDIQSGERDEEAKRQELADQQPGDPKVKTNTGDLIVERDATDEEVNAAGDKKPEHVTPENDEDTPANERNDFGGRSGQVEDDAATDEEATVKLENPSGRTVVVREADISRRKLFAAGFKLAKGQKYSDDIKKLDEAYRQQIKARGLYNDVDQSDPGQSNAQGDIARRAGSKEAGDSDGKPQARIAKPNTKVEGKTFEDGIDKRENNQVVNPKTNKPKSTNRLSQALNG